LFLPREESVVMHMKLTGGSHRSSAASLPALGSSTSSTTKCSARSRRTSPTSHCAEPIPQPPQRLHPARHRAPGAGVRTTCSPGRSCRPPARSHGWASSISRTKTGSPAPSPPRSPTSRQVRHQNFDLSHNALHGRMPVDLSYPS
jgi:hypothetical protein